MLQSRGCNQRRAGDLVIGSARLPTLRVKSACDIVNCNTSVKKKNFLNFYPFKGHSNSNSDLSQEVPPGPYPGISLQRASKRALS